MKQAILRAPRVFEIVDAPKPQPRAGEALVRITGVGVCGSDMHMYKEGNVGGIRIEQAPGGLIVGHEAAGVIEAVGEGVDASRVGQSVAIEPCIPCGRCQWCQAGQTNVCPTHEFLGLPGCNGAMRQYMAHPAHLCAPVPDEFTSDEIVMLEPLAIAMYAVDRGQPLCGAAALVLGSGPIGLTVMAVLASMNVTPIIATDKLDYRLELARQVGATHTLNPLRDDVVAAVRDITGGFGSPRVFEAAGDEQTFEQMVECAAPGGVVAVLGIPVEDRLSFKHSLARRKGLDIRMVRRSNQTLARSVAWLKGNWPRVARLVTHHWPLGQSRQAYDTVAAYADGVIKGIIEP